MKSKNLLRSLLCLLLFVFCSSLSVFSTTPEIAQKSRTSKVKKVMTLDQEARENLFYGDRCYGFGDFATAVRYYERALSIDSTCVKGWTRLGMMYKAGLGVEQDYSKAVECLMKGAALDDPGANFNVGTFYLAGKGVQRDDAEAMKWFQRASELGSPDAQYQIGCLYFNGIGVEQNYLTALEWFQLAAKKRYLAALVNIGFMCANGLGVVKDPAIGVQWYLHAAKYGSVEAMRNLGGCYHFGQGVDKDREEALAWYKKAAAKGDQESIKYLKKIGQYEEAKQTYVEKPMVLTAEDLAEEEAEGAAPEAELSESTDVEDGFEEELEEDLDLPATPPAKAQQ